MPHCHIVTSTTHKTLRGPRGGIILSNDEDLMKKASLAVFPGLQGGPHMNNIAAKAVAFKEALSPEFRTYSQRVLDNAQAMCDVFKARKIKLVGGGTTNHLILLDVYNDGKGITGKEMEKALEYVGITVNKNMIPNDPLKALDPSGIRIGTPAITSRNYTEHDSKKVAHIICDVHEALTSSTEPMQSSLHKARVEVKELASMNPLSILY
jgi:glycine hydroxymethyltransferase